MEGTRLTKMDPVERGELNYVEPGLYVLDEVTTARTEHAGSEGRYITIRYTGRMLARVRRSGDLPPGTTDAWRRGLDGKAVVVFEETVLE